MRCICFNKENTRFFMTAAPAEIKMIHNNLKLV